MCLVVLSVSYASDWVVCLLHPLGLHRMQAREICSFDSYGICRGVMKGRGSGNHGATRLGATGRELAALNGQNLAGT